MATRLRQASYAPMPFGVDKTNVHYSDARPSSVLIIFIHGLGGSGYGTWGDFPRYLFDGPSNDRCDVAVFDYISGFRRWHARKASMTFYINQVVDAIRQTANDYDAIFLVGHSLGGVVAEAAAVSYLQQLPPTPFEAVSRLGAVIYMGAPRAGTQWALPLLRKLGDEGRLLQPMSAHSTQVDDYLVSRTDVALTSPLAAAKFYLPRYAFYSGTDLWVNQFSSTYGIPGPQRIPLVVSHTKMPKPASAQAQQVIRLQEIVRDVSGARRQRIRESSHSSTHIIAPPLPVSQTVTTEFWAPADASNWVQTYNEVRRSATTADIVVLDRNTSKFEVDLLISASHAEAVLDSQSAERHRFDAAHAKRMSNPRLTVGLAPVGSTATAAAAVIIGWHNSVGATPQIYVEGSTNTAELRDNMAKWIELVVGSDPRRGPADLVGWGRTVSQDDRLYNPMDGGMHQ
jgi:pimeloyl-ACP methyl ester carboxylesterase